MKGDFSRDTYRPEAHYTRVMMQQGRVQLDSDWNEQTSILLGYMRALTRDLFGRAAGPAEDCGFQVVTAEMLDKLPDALKKEVDDALKSENADFGHGDLLVLRGRYYVGGLPVEAEGPVLVRARMGFPDFEAEVNDLNKHSWIAYLDVWEDFVSADQDPDIRETALNGVDTCGRARIRWKVSVLLDPEAEDAVFKLPQFAPSGMRARANPTEEPDKLCTIQPDARYRGAENQLYRVEIHVGGSSDAGATFKWSRDNGSVTFPIRSAKGKRVALHHLGRDEATTLVEGDWVELVDDIATGLGPLAQVATVERDDLQIVLTAGSPAVSYKEDEARARHAFLRRWDQRGDLSKSGGAIPVVEGAVNELELEDGIKVAFEPNGTYRAGDYWLIPARVATGEVEWPGVPDAPEFRPPHGPAHHYAPLLSRTHKPLKIEDLRCRIARLLCIVDPAPAPATPGRT